MAVCWHGDSEDEEEKRWVNARLVLAFQSREELLWGAPPGRRGGKFPRPGAGAWLLLTPESQVALDGVAHTGVLSQTGLLFLSGGLCSPAPHVRSYSPPGCLFPRADVADP